MKGKEVMEWKTQRYEGSVGVDGRWVVSRSEAEARVEAAEERAREAEYECDKMDTTIQEYKRTLAAVREPLVEIAENLERRDPHDEAAAKLRIILHRLDREGEK